MKTVASQLWPLESISSFLHQSLRTRNLRDIKKLHACLLRTGFIFVSLNLHAQLICAYASCLPTNSSQTLTRLFKCMNPKNPLRFNSLISYFCRTGSSTLALNTFSFMHISSVPLDTYALSGSLSALCSIRNVGYGRQIHAHAAKLGWMSSVFVGSALIDLYAKSSYIEDASNLFDQMPVKNTVCANALLSGFAEAKSWDEGLELVRKMQTLSLRCDHFTLSALLRVCAGLSAIELGKQVHAHLIRADFDMETDVFVQSSLIEMYGKCGFAEKALQSFELKGFEIRKQRKLDVVLWTSMLSAYGRNGQFEEVIGLYEQMLREAIRPDGVAFLAVLSACSHTGHLGLGVKYFKSMSKDFGLDPEPEHCSCLVDLFCRAGDLECAWKLVDQVSSNGGSKVSMWGALLSACAECGNVELGKVAAQRALELDPQNVGIYVMLSNLHARRGMWDEIRDLREVVKEKGLKKILACSWIES